VALVHIGTLDQVDVLADRACETASLITANVMTLR
jgi:hypothetical protein